MTNKYFGTDGIRGVANQFPITSEIAIKVGMAAGSIYKSKNNYRPRVVIGKDTRLSGYLIETALTSGFISVGIDVFLVGPLPTPAIAMLTRSMRADLGVVISASHNPYSDNGIKLFGPDGYKLSNKMEQAIETRIDGELSQFLANSHELGRAKRIDDAPGRYIEFVKSSLPKGKVLDGLKIVIDTANGAAYHLGATILWELGADVISINDKPDGFNINENCGSTSPKSLCQAVLDHKADIGIALDGDADRLAVCDEKGKIVDGDQILALIATSWKKQGRIKGDGIVATIMSNFGLERYLQTLGLKLYRTNVGDRNVSAQMQAVGCNIGGEQSGHIILSDYVTTGDGLISALQVLSVLLDKQQPASEALHSFEQVPQILKNIKYNKSQKPLENQHIQQFILDKEKLLGDKGRIVIRASGTEPVIRVMGESEDGDLAKSCVDDIIEEIKKFVVST